MTIRRHGLQELYNVRRWLAANDEADGEEMTRELERLIERDYPAKRVIAVNSAMAALHTALQLVGVGPGDEVIVDAIVAFGGMSVMYHNAVPIFADLDPDTFNTDPASVEKRITPRTKAIICTHLLGNPCEMEKLVAIAKKHNVALIEDCAHSLFAKRNGTYAGMFGDFGAFSFNFRKHMSTGQGGFLTINRDDYVARSRYKNHNRVTPRLIWNYQMPSLVSAIALAQWPRAKSYVAEDHEYASLFDRACAGCDWLIPQKILPGNWSSSLCWGARFRGDEVGIDYDEFLKVLERKGGKRFVPSWMPRGAYGLDPSPAYLYPMFAEPVAYGDKGCPTRCPHYEGVADYSRGICPNAEYLVGRLLNIALTPASQRKLARHADALRQTIAHFSRRRN